MGQLTYNDKRELEQLEAVLDAFEVAYMEAGRALTVIRDKELHRESDENFDRYVNERFGYSKSHSYRLISAYEAVQDVKQVESPNGGLLPPPQNERVARELAEVETPEQRADLWAKASGTSPREVPTAAHTAKTRREMFPPEESNGEADAQDAKPVEQPLWEQFAAKHAEVLKHLTQAKSCINSIFAEGESAAYLQPVRTRIDTDYRALRGTIFSNCPSGEEGGEIVTKVQERK